MSASSLQRMLRMQIVVEQRIFWRNPSTVVFTFLLPLLLLAFLGAFTDPDQLVPGIAALSVMSVAFQGTAMQLAMHRDQGVLKRLMATPLPVGVLVLGKIVSVLVVVLLELAAVLLVGVGAFGVHPPASPGLLVLGVVVGVVVFVALGAAVASAIGSSDSAPAVVNGIFVPMMFLSGVFHQVSDLPPFVQSVSALLPLTHLVDVVRAAWIGPAGWGDGALPWASLGALALWGVGATLWTARRFRWQPAWER